MNLLRELNLDGEGSVYRIRGADLCELLGITPPALTKLKDRGIAVHIGRDAWDLLGTINAYVCDLRETASGRGGAGHVDTLTRERARLAKSKADREELTNAKLRGDLLPASEVESTWSDQCRAIRSRILSIPPRFQAEQKLNRGQTQALDRELRDTLTELGHGDH